MKKCKMSAGTAAKNRSKCSLLAGRHLLLAMLLLCVVSGKAQKFDTSLVKFMPVGGAMASSITMMADSLLTFRVYDSLKGEVVISWKDSLMVKDSLAAIKTLIKVSKYEFERAKKQNEKYLAAQEILKFLTTTGTVTDRKKFDAAVKEYMKLNAVSK